MCSQSFCRITSKQISRFKPLIEYFSFVFSDKTLLDVTGRSSRGKLFMIYPRSFSSSSLSEANKRSTITVKVGKTVQINLCQKLLFLHQLNLNMTTNSSPNYMKIPSSNLGRACCVQKLFLTFRTIFVHNMFSPGFSLEFLCIELVIQ